MAAFAQSFSLPLSSRRCQVPAASVPTSGIRCGTAVIRQFEGLRITQVRSKPQLQQRMCGIGGAQMKGPRVRNNQAALY